MICAFLAFESESSALGSCGFALPWVRHMDDSLSSALSQKPARTQSLSSHGVSQQVAHSNLPHFAPQRLYGPTL